MYQNTPWERIVLYAPWIGLATLVLALLYWLITRRARDEGANRITGNLAALGASFAGLGILFTKYWREAHDAYPTIFGHAAIRVAIAGAILGILLLAIGRTRRLIWASTFGFVTATVAAAAAVSAFSHSIIAEGQVTAMALPMGYLACAIVAAIVAAFIYRFGSGDDNVHDLVSAIVFIVFAWIMSNKLPVVQFHPDSSVYPVTGGAYIVTLARLARLWALPVWAMGAGALAAIAIGYLLGEWYGVAIAAVGLSISGALGRLRQPSEEFPLQRSTPA